MLTLDVAHWILRKIGIGQSDRERYAAHQRGYELCESPIERAYWSVAYFALRDYGDLIPQYQIGLYRLDFALVNVPGCRLLKVAIELDGHDYHSSQDQRNHDTDRERWLMRHGWQVVRFTGSQINRDAEACVRETVELVEEWRGWLKGG